MKNHCYFLLLLLFLSCNKKENQAQKINPSDLHLHEIVHESLTPKQIEKITKIHSIFAEVDENSLEQTINDFKRDINPDNEIEIWMQMANAYKGYLSQNPKNLDEKKEVFRLILSRSMMNSEEAIENSDLKFLSVEDATEVLSFYTNQPEPLVMD